MRALILQALATVLLAAPQPAAGEPDTAVLGVPGGGNVAWDLKAIDKRFEVVKVKHYERTKEVVLLLQAKEDMSVKKAEFEAYYFDSDAVRLISNADPNEITLEGGDLKTKGEAQTNLQRGERLRVWFRLPVAAVWKNTRYVVVGSKAPPAGITPWQPLFTDPSLKQLQSEFVR